jgi:hypothetical protein
MAYRGPRRTSTRQKKTFLSTVDVLFTTLDVQGGKGFTQHTLFTDSFYNYHRQLSLAVVDNAELAKCKHITCLH